MAELIIDGTGQQRIVLEAGETNEQAYDQLSADWAYIPCDSILRTLIEKPDDAETPNA